MTKLAATVHNPYFIDEVVQFLNQICPGCLNPKENVNMKVFVFLIDLISSSLSMADRLPAKLNGIHNFVSQVTFR